MSAKGIPKWPLGHEEEKLNIEDDFKRGEPDIFIVEKDNATDLRNSNTQDCQSFAAAESHKNRPVDHLLHAIGVIFGDSVSGNTIQLENIADNSCSQQVATRILLDQTYNEKETSTRSLSCHLCKQTFSKRSDLKQHSFTHTGHLRYKCDFEDCNWSFNTKYKLRRHMMVHTCKKRFTCPVNGCEKSFTEAHGLKVHMQSHMSATKCQVSGCGAKFPSLKKHEDHMRRRHLMKPYKCKEENCTMVFESEFKLIQHTACHGNYRCTIPGCNKSFLRKSVMNIHARSHTNDRPFRCNIEGCGAAFMSTSKLNRHTKKHSDERPFSCTFDGCSASFKRQDHLTKHLTQHDGKKPYICPIDGCHSRFTALGSLKNHIDCHTKHNCYACPIQGCTKKYYCKPTLKNHIKRHKAKLEEKFQNSDPTNDGRGSECLVFVEPSESSMKDASIQVDVTESYASNDAAINLHDAHCAAAALGEAACFHYINEIPSTNVVSSSQTATKQCIAPSETEKFYEKSGKASPVKRLLPRAGSCTSVNQVRNKFDKSESASLSHDNATAETSNASRDIRQHCVSSANETTRLDLTSSIFCGEAITVPLSMTRFLPQDIQVAEYLSNEYRNDHAYNRTLLSTDPRVLVSSENRNLDSGIANVLSPSGLDGHLSVSVSDSMLEVRSLLVENGMASFLANDDIGRMETCASEDDLGINRKFDLPVNPDLDVSLLIDDCVIERRSATLNTGFSHYSSHDSYVSSLMESPHTVSEHLLNISNNPTMVDHMYSQHGPEEDDLQIVSEDHAYEESTVNIQDIR